MLIITRKVGQAFKVGEDIYVRIISVKGRAVRIAIHAPKEVPVHREEIYERIKKEREQAPTQSEPNDRALMESTLPEMVKVGT